MPRDGTATKERISNEASRLFAERGIYQVTNREITEAAGQRNVSALNYHFGGREELLAALLTSNGGPVDDARGRLLGELDDAPTTDDLIACLVVPYAACLGTEHGRQYVQIVAQLRGRFAAWRVESDTATTTHLQRILDSLEERPPGVSADIRTERLVGMIMLMTSAVAERARTIETGSAPALDHDGFVDNLVTMLTGVLEPPRSRTR